MSDAGRLPESVSAYPSPCGLGEKVILTFRLPSENRRRESLAQTDDNDDEENGSPAMRRLSRHETTGEANERDDGPDRLQPVCPSVRQLRLSNPPADQRTCGHFRSVRPKRSARCASDAASYELTHTRSRQAEGPKNWKHDSALARGPDVADTCGRIGQWRRSETTCEETVGGKVSTTTYA